MPDLPQGKILLTRVSLGTTASDHVERGAGNAVLVEAWPDGVGSADLTVLDSADPVTGYSAALDPAGTVPGMTVFTKKQVTSVLPFVTVRLANVSGNWTVRVTPIEAVGQTTVTASISGAVGQGAPGSTASPWPVRGSDGTNLSPAGDSSARPVYQRLAAAAYAAGNHAEATNASVTITYAAGGAGVKHVTGGVAWSFSAAPPAGTTLTVTDGGTTVRKITITAAGPGELLWPDEAGAANAALVVTLATGGAGVLGTLDVLGKRTET